MKITSFYKIKKILLVPCRKYILKVKKPLHTVKDVVTVEKKNITKKITTWIKKGNLILPNHPFFISLLPHFILFQLGIRIIKPFEIKSKLFGIAGALNDLHAISISTVAKWEGLISHYLSILPLEYLGFTDLKWTLGMFFQSFIMSYLFDGRKIIFSFIIDFSRIIGIKLWLKGQQIIITLRNHLHLKGKVIDPAASTGPTRECVVEAPKKVFPTDNIDISRSVTGDAIMPSGIRRLFSEGPLQRPEFWPQDQSRAGVGQAPLTIPTLRVLNLKENKNNLINTNRALIEQDRAAYMRRREDLIFWNADPKAFQVLDDQSAVQTAIRHNECKDILKIMDNSSAFRTTEELGALEEKGKKVPDIIYSEDTSSKKD